MTISGRIYNQQTNEPIWNANVFVSNAAGVITAQAIGGASDFDGAYRFNSTVTPQYITCRVLGYKTITLPYQPDKTVYNFGMSTDMIVFPPYELIEKPITWFERNKKYVIVGTTTLLLALAAYFTENYSNNSHK